MNLQSIVEITRINGTKAYDTNKEFISSDKNKEIVRFCNKTVCIRKTNDCSRNKDNDVYIGLNKEGWIKYTHDLQSGCEFIKINNWYTCLLSDTDIINFLQSDECTDEEYLMFMSTAYTFYK